MKDVKRRPIPDESGAGCIPMECSDELMRFLFEIPSPWHVDSVSVGGNARDMTKTVHVNLVNPEKMLPCPNCGTMSKVYDHQHRTWRDMDMGDSACFIHALVPRVRCTKCGGVRSIPVEWADKKVSYTRRFAEDAIRRMAHTSLRAVSRQMAVKYHILDNIVELEVRDHLDRLDLSHVRRCRIDEVSAKKRHRYITIVTDADTGDVIFITKGKNKATVEEFGIWLTKHHGDPNNILSMVSDFGTAFRSGISEYLPNAVNVFDPFHLVQLANEALDSVRATAAMVGRTNKKIRYALLRDKDNWKEGDHRIILDVTKDNFEVGVAYSLKETLRQVYDCLSKESARDHLLRWAVWADHMTQKHRIGRKFSALAKTVRNNLEGILAWFDNKLNNGFQEGLNAKVQLTKRLANGYHREEGLARMIFFRDMYRAC